MSDNIPCTHLTQTGGCTPSATAWPKLRDMRQGQWFTFANEPEDVHHLWVTTDEGTIARLSNGQHEERRSFHDCEVIPQQVHFELTPSTGC